MSVVIVLARGNGIWNAFGGFRVPAPAPDASYLVGALGPGALSLDEALGVVHRTGNGWAAGAVLLGAAAGLLTFGAARSLGTDRNRQAASPAR